MGDETIIQRPPASRERLEQWIGMAGRSTLIELRELESPSDGNGPPSR
jgi:hypothetical protein